jgi:hypothetical protein
MSQSTPHYFDLETIALLREALEDAWACLRPTAREHLTRSLLGERILKAASRGERDRERLIEAALDEQLAA